MNIYVTLMEVFFKKYLMSKGGFSSYWIDTGLIPHRCRIDVFVSEEKYGIGRFYIKIV